VSKTPRIRTPWRQRWRRIRYQLLPLVVFVATAAGAIWLWGRHVGLPNALGEVHAVRADAVSLIAGRLASMEGEVFTEVAKDQVVAELDPGLLKAMRATYVEEQKQAADQLDASREEFTQQWEARHKAEVAEKRRLEQAIERLRQDILDRENIIETDKVELARKEIQLEAISELVQSGVEARWREVEIRSERDVIEKRITGNLKALKEAKDQKTVSEERLREYVLTQQADLAKLLAPVQAAIDTQAKRIEELNLQIEALKIRAPIAGTITAVYQSPGQNVQAGIPIMTIAAADSRYIVSYVRQETRIRPVVGMDVDVNVRSLPRLTAGATVEEVGPQVELIPPHQLRDPNVPEWGLPVRISVPAKLGLRPGELVDVTFKPAVTFAFTARGRDETKAVGEVQVADGAPQAGRTD